MSPQDAILVLSVAAEIGLIYSCVQMIKSGKVELGFLEVTAKDNQMRFYIILILYALLVSLMLIYINL